jgi:hypothetical protein
VQIALNILHITDTIGLPGYSLVFALVFIRELVAIRNSVDLGTGSEILIENLLSEKWIGILQEEYGG